MSIYGYILYYLIPTIYRTRPLWITYLVADFCVRAPENGRKLVLEEAHYYNVLVYKRCGLVLYLSTLCNLEC